MVAVQHWVETSALPRVSAKQGRPARADAVIEYPFASVHESGYGALFGHGAMSDLSPLCEDLTRTGHGERARHAKIHARSHAGLRIVC